MTLRLHFESQHLVTLLVVFFIFQNEKIDLVFEIVIVASFVGTHVNDEIFIFLVLIGKLQAST